MSQGSQMFVLRTAMAAVASAALACGGGSPTAPPTPPSPTPVPGHTVTVTVFYDENANGTLESSAEGIRIPDVEVVIGGRSARSAGGGVVTVANVPAGTQAITVRAETVPPFFVVTGSPSVVVPQPADSVARLGLYLPIGTNRPNVYMAFGDSITRGDGAPMGASYPAKLQTKLVAHFGGGQVNNRGADATNSFEALERLNRNIEGSSP